MASDEQAMAEYYKLVEAEDLIRSGSIPLSDMGEYGDALRAFLAEYDRRGAELGHAKEKIRQLTEQRDLYRRETSRQAEKADSWCAIAHDVADRQVELDTDGLRQIPLPPEPPTQGDVSAWLVERFGPTRSLTAQFHKLISEVGELSDAMLGRTEGFPPPAEGWDQNFRDEAADVVLVVMALAVTEGFDLQEAIASKWSRRKRGAVPAEGGDSSAE